MASIYGIELSKSELMKRVGDISQIAGARQSVLDSGRARGVRIVEVKTGGGLNFSVLPDRGMDIAWADYKGAALSFISKTGVVSPSYYEPEGDGFLKSFFGGLLTTCGLTYMGAACDDDGRRLGLHGRASNISAEDVCVTNEWESDDFIMTIRGRIRECALLGENIALSRKIETRIGENRLILEDKVENWGFIRQPLMILYHFNFGFPLLDKGTKLIIPKGHIKVRDNETINEIGCCCEFTAPIHEFSEQVFYHEFDPDTDDEIVVKLINERFNGSGLGIYISYNNKQLPYLIEWKQLGEGDYVVGLEPATWYPEGRSKARKKGELLYIEPGEVKKYRFEIGIISDD